MDRAMIRILKVNYIRHYRRFATSSNRFEKDTAGTSQNHQKKNSKLQDGPSLEHFIANSHAKPAGRGLRMADTAAQIPYLTEMDIRGDGKSVYFEVHGCQMNVSDIEVVWSILQDKGYKRSTDITDRGQIVMKDSHGRMRTLADKFISCDAVMCLKEADGVPVMTADVVLIMTCTIRQGAEDKIYKKLQYLSKLKRRRTLGSAEMKIGILGCMAKRLNPDLLNKDKLVDVVCGPDAYKHLPRLLAVTRSRQTAVNVMLSLDETYADVQPVRLNPDSVTAFVSIMRGCDNMCSYCIVPFTRGRERSRPIDSIVDEVRMLSDQGVKEVTLLGQNVNSYRDTSESKYYGNSGLSSETQLSAGFKTIYKPKTGGRRFSELLDRVSQVDPEMRVRFTSPHPKDFPDEVLQLIKERDNICNQFHMPAQSGNNDVLKKMRRGYTIEAYHELVEKIRNVLKGVALTSDFISGFCGETEAAHQDTVSLIRKVKYHTVYCYPFSKREKTNAYYHLEDDVPEDVKTRRFQELAQVYRQEAAILNNAEVGRQHLVLIEGTSKRSTEDWAGRNDNGVKVIFPDSEIQFHDGFRHPKPGDYVVNQIINSSSQVLHGIPLYGTTLQEYSRKSTPDRLALQS